MKTQSERLYSETKAALAPLKPLTEHLVDRLLQLGEMGLAEVLSEIRSFEALQARFLCVRSVNLSGWFGEVCEAVLRR